MRQTHLIKGSRHLIKGSSNTWLAIVGNEKTSILQASDRSWIVYTASRILLNYMDHFDRKIMSRITKWPYLILIFVKRPPNEPCDERQHLAASILHAADKDLHVVPLKLKKTYLDDLKHTSETKLLGSWLAVALMEVRSMWRAHTTENERMNKLLKLIGERAPSSTYESASARCQLKYELSLGVTDGKNKSFPLTSFKVGEN